MNGRTAHSAGTVVLSLLMLVIGVALLGQALAGDGSILSARVVLGVLFLAAGAGRVFVEARRRRGTNSR
jgi:hypothetical protein